MTDDDLREAAIKILGYRVRLFDPLNKIQDAWLLVEKMLEDKQHDWNLSLHVFRGGLMSSVLAEFHCPIGHGRDDGHGSGKTQADSAPRAITIAAVEAVSVTGQEVVPLLKDASEVTGIWDLTGGVNPVEHIRRMRDD